MTSMENKESARAGLLVVAIRNTLSDRCVVFSREPEVVRSAERALAGDRVEGQGVRTLAWSWSTTDGSVTCSLQDLKNTPITISIRRNYTRARTTMKWLVFTRMRHGRQDIDRADVYGHRDHPQHISSTRRPSRAAPVHALSQFVGVPSPLTHLYFTEWLILSQI